MSMDMYYELCNVEYEPDWYIELMEEIEDFENLLKENNLESFENFFGYTK